MASGSNSRGLVLLLITSCFFITGLLFDYMPMIIDDHIKRTIELATNEEIIGFWSKPPIEVHSYYWLYDISNAEQFQKAGEKPQVRKVGPFHFTSRIEKRLIELSANKFRLTYNSTRYMQLNESYSAELLDAPLQLLNPILGSIIEGVRVNGQQLDGQSRAVAMGSVNRLFERYNESIVSNTTARVALLGRPMPIVDKLRRIAETFGMGQRLPDMPPPGSKIGYVALLNATWSGPFEIYTGYQETAQSLGDIISYKGKKRLDYYEGKCNRLQASAGELRPMPIDPDQKLEIFNPSFCRLAHLQPTSQVKLREGQAIKYMVAPEDLLSAQSNPDNRCFCTNTTDDDDHCSLDGVVDLAPCSYDAPILLTLSNVQLDPKITATIQDFDSDMLRGDVEQIADADERAQFVVLKRVGVPIRADLTVTLMMKLTRDPAFKQTANVPQVSYVPLMTARETVSIPPKLAQIIVNLESFLSLTYHIKVVMYLTAIVLLCWLTGHYYCRTSAQVNADQRAANGSGNQPGGDPDGSRRNRRSASNCFGSNETNAFGDGEMGVNSFTGRQQRLSIGSPLQPGAGPMVGGAQETAAKANGAPNDNGLAAAATSGARFRNNPMRPQLRTVEEAITQAAQTNDTTSGERANSADSSRSLPPSRQASRFDSLEGGNSSSIDQTAPIESADENNNNNNAEPIRSQPSGGGGGVARIFSKVDEMLAARGNKQTGAGAGAGDKSRSSLNEAPQLIDGQTTAGTTNEPANEVSGQRARKRRRGWFMNVYSRFVGMLSGIRNTIEDAGQLDVRESRNDYQDKRLEMLAGKIDNWYSSSPLTSDTGASEAAAPDEQSANTSDHEVARTMAERDTGQQLAASVAIPSDGTDIMQARPEMNDDATFKTKRLVSHSVVAASEADANDGDAERAPDGGMSTTNQRASLRSGDEGNRRPADRNSTPAASQKSDRPTGQMQKDAGSGVSGDQITPALASSRADVERDKITGARHKRSLDRTKADESPALNSDKETAAVTNVDLGAIEDDEAEDDEAVESEEEAARREEDEAHKAATLKRVEDALEAGDKSNSDSGESGRGTDFAESASAKMSSSELDGRNTGALQQQQQQQHEQQRRPHVAMINSSTSIDSVINSTALNGDDVSASSFESYVTQVATDSTTKAGQNDEPDNDNANNNNHAAVLSSPNQSAGDETTVAAAPAAANEQIDESSGVEQRKQWQSNKWSATGRAADVIGPASEQLANGDLPSAGARESPKLATSRRSDLSRAPMATDNGRALAKLDARNGISGSSAAGKQAASSLTELEDRTKPASVNGKLDEPSGDLSAKESDQAAANGMSQANRAYALGPAAQMKGIVAAPGQPINVGASPTMTKSLIGTNSAPPDATPADLLLANGQLAASRRLPPPPPPPTSEGSVTRRRRPAAFQANQQASRQWIGANGNNILNEKIISHQQQWPRHKKKSAGGGRGVASAVRVNQTLALNSNQRSANRTTGNHHHQRVQPAGV